MSWFGAQAAMLVVVTGPGWSSGRPSNRAEPEQAIGSGKHHMGMDIDFTPDRNAKIGGSNALF
jgi:hypothetical protein